MTGPVWSRGACRGGFGVEIWEEVWGVGSWDMFLLQERERTERGRKVTDVSLELTGMNKNFRSRAYRSLAVW